MIPVNKSVNIGLIEESEIDAVAELSARAYEADYTISPGYRSSIVAVRERVEADQVWVARDAASGALLGTVSTPRPGAIMTQVAQPGEMDFRLLAVDPSARRRGIGELLVEHVIGLARERGIEHLVMNSGPEMVGAHRLYERMGFRRMLDREPLLTFPDGRQVKVLAFGLNTQQHAHSGPAESH